MVASATAAAQVLEHRLRLGLTRAQLAEALGVHPRTIKRWERAAFRPHPIYLIRLSNMQPEVTDGNRDRTAAGSHTVDAHLHLERPGVPKVTE